MNIWLKELEINDGVEYLELLNELSSYKDVYAKPIPEPITKEDYIDFKKFRIRMMLNDNLPEKIVQTSTYWVMKDSTPIGYATLKHKVLENTTGGHFGCCLRKEYQNRGIGSIVSQLLSKIAYEDLEIEEIIYTAKKENIHIQKSLKNIGATFFKEENDYYYYKVDLKKKFNKEGRKL